MEKDEEEKKLKIKSENNSETVSSDSINGRMTYIGTIEYFSRVKTSKTGRNAFSIC